MSDVERAIAFAASIYRQRAASAYAGYVQRDPLALLESRPGRADPYAIYEQIRARGSLVPTRMGNWMTTSHQVCDAVLRNRRFGVRPAGDPGPAEADGFNLSFLEMNPPDHTRLRRLALPAFSPRAVGSYRDRITGTVGGLLDQATANGEFDLVSDLAGPLPIAVITDLLGIPDADATDFTRYGMVIGSALDGIRSLGHARQLQASSTQLERLFESLFAVRRRDPRDDIISRLVTAQEDQVKPAEMVPMCVLLLIAGFETTVNLISNSVLALLSHPAQWRALCDDPAGLAAKAVEETLRYDPPVQLTSRVALEATELDGKPVRRDQRGQLAGPDRLGGDVGERIERLQQPPVRHVGGEHAALLCLPQYGQDARLHRAPALLHLRHMIEGGGPPQERQLRPDRDHRRDQRAQPAVFVRGAGHLVDDLLPQVERTVPDRAQQVVPGGIVLVQRGAADASRLRHLGQRRRRICHQHLGRDIKQRQPPRPPRRDRPHSVNTHVRKPTSMFQTKQHHSPKINPNPRRPWLTGAVGARVSRWPEDSSLKISLRSTQPAN